MRTVFRVLFIVLVVGWSACARSHLDVGDGLAGSSAETGGTNEPAAFGSGTSESDHVLDGKAGFSSSIPDSGGTTTPGNGARDASTQDAANEVADEVGGTEVWIGQLWSIAPGLCDPEAPWESTPLVVQPTGYIERVVLVLELGDNPASPSGVIRFGQGELPADAGPAPGFGSDPGSFWLCSMQVPSKGGEYTLLGARRAPQRIGFEIEPGAIWNSCDEDDPQCRPPCEGPVCGSVAGTRLSFDLLVSGDTMEGTLPEAGGGFGTPAELRLRRAQ